MHKIIKKKKKITSLKNLRGGRNSEEAKILNTNIFKIVKNKYEKYQMVNLFCCKPYGPYHPIQIQRGKLSFYLICTKP